MALIDDLVSYWKLDVDAANQIDSHGSNDGTVDGAVFDAGGLINNCYDFDGDNDFISLANPENLSPDDNDWSLSLWFKTNNTTADDRILFASWNTEISDWLTLGFNSSHEINFQVDDGSDPRTNLNAGSGWNDDVWHLAVVTRNAATNEWVLWVDGVNQDSDSLTDSSVDTVNNAKIGQDWNGARGWGGLIDEVAIFDKVLSEAEIEELFNGGVGFAYPFLTPEDLELYVEAKRKELKTFWPIEEGLTSGTQKQTGRVMNLVPQNSNVLRDEKIGLR